MKRSLMACIVLLGVAVGCESPPEERCQATQGEGSIDFDCEGSGPNSWQDSALEEADEGMEQRGPGGRP